jgi:hypothetical protein
MRQIIAAVFVLAFSATPSLAASGHWYCTADGIKSWTSDPNTSDAAGWNYSGDRSSYKDGGHCSKKM